MSQIQWIKGPICGVDNCRSRLYRSSDGMKICQYGHVMDGNVEINDEHDEGIVSTRRLNVPLGGLGADYGFLTFELSQAMQARDSNRRLYGNDGRKLYLRCLQVLLKRQTEHIVRLMLDESSLGDVMIIVKTHWLRCLKFCLRSSHSEPVDEMIHFRYNDPQNVLPNALDLISIIYLSVLKLNAYPLYVRDLIDNIRTNKIPYVRTTHLIPKHYLDKLPSSYFQLLQPPTLPIKNELYSSIQINGFRTNLLEGNCLKRSINYYYLLIFRIFSESLILPSAANLFILFNQLFNKLDETLELVFESRTRRSSSNLIDFPDLKILALIIFTIKTHFAFDESRINLKEWLERIDMHELNGEYSFSTSSKLDLLNWSDTKTEKYCQWLYENIIPPTNKSQNNGAEHQPLTGSELSIMERRLFQIFNVEPGSYNRSDSLNNAREPKLLSLNEILQSMALETTKINLSDLSAMEEKLFSKLSNDFGVTSKLLRECYNALELRINAKLIAR
ncbi:uncharacterized protein PRCAT00001230001 [Priceomyces carsonii]|uniref:uncharacterized protein n=1 Tax=Priceomyces carsonii TaxID=28549 RepID=UPI002ED90FE2|nr:unnamed protein product [Priceomyces carsonii]